MEKIKKVQENSQTYWHFIEKKNLQLELNHLVTKGDEMEEKINEIFYDFEMFSKRSKWQL